MALADGLHRLLEPRSIAVVGASDRPDSYGDTILRNLERLGYEGDVWGVNPSRERIRAVECVPALTDLPHPVDAVAIAIPAAGVPAVIREAAELGCGGGVVISAGFGEVIDGVPLEAELRETALGAGFPVCGPNGNGIVSLSARSAIWGDSVHDMPAGAVALISQSGNVAVNALGSRRGIRFHTVVSTGNQAVCDASDWLSAIAAADGVRSVGLFLEDDGDGARFAAALADCAEREIGVAVLKVGSSESGSEAAAAHTGALAGDQSVFRSLVEEAGAAWAEDPHDLLELARVLAEPRARPRGRGGLGVLTCSGGDSGLAADHAERLGLELPALGAEATRTLRDLLPDAATVGNPLDYTSLIWAETERLAAIVEAVGNDPAIDQLLLFHDTPADLAAEVEPGWCATRTGLADGAERAGAAPLFASTLPDLIGENEIGELAERGIAAVQGLGTALRCAAALRGAGADAERLREIAGTAARAKGGEGEWLGEIEAKTMLEAHGVAVPRRGVSSDIATALVAAEEIGYPVALKLSSPALQHKSDAGAVALGIAGAEALEREASRLLGLPEARGAGLLVERMAANGGVELIVAARTDGVVPALVLGLGGVWAEAMEDVVVVPLPADAARVRDALSSLRASPLLRGDRGSEGVDLDAAAQAAARVGELALAEGLSLLEVNPLLAGPDGCVALDAVARRG